MPISCEICNNPDGCKKLQGFKKVINGGGNGQLFLQINELLGSTNCGPVNELLKNMKALYGKLLRLPENASADETIRLLKPSSTK